MDPESGIMHFRNRYYSGELGRFVTRDPIVYRDGMNLYAGYFAQMMVLDALGLSSGATCCGTDVTDWLMEEMNRNVSHEFVTSHKEAIRKSDSALLKAAIAALFGDKEEAGEWLKEAAK